MIPASDNALDFVITIGAQLPVVLLFVYVIFKLLDRFDKVQEARDKSFLAALETVTSRVDQLQDTLVLHDRRVDERIAQTRERGK